MNQKTPIKSKIENGIWKIERYGTYEGNTWNEVRATGTSNIYLMFKNLCLILVSNQTLIEHISVLNDNVRMVQKNESLGIILTKEGMKMKKLRVKFAGTGIYPGVAMAHSCVKTLKRYIKIEHVAPTQSGDNLFNQESNTVSLSQHISELLNKNITEFYADNNDLSRLYPLEDTVEACILDTDFPSFVAEVHGILLKKLK